MAGAGGATVGPRAVGIALVLVSGAVGVVAAALMPQPALGIPAAIVLALASVGVLAGGLWIPRRSWADKTWPPGLRSRTLTARGNRLRARVYGVFLVGVGVAGGVGAVLGGSPRGDSPVAAGLLVATLVGVGVAILVWGLLPIPAAVAGDTRVDDEPATAQDGWIVLGRGTAGVSGAALMTVLPTFALGLVYVAFQGLLVAERMGVWALVIAIAALAVAVVVLVILVRRRAAAPSATVDGAMLRLRGREIAAADITAASLFWSPWEADATARSLTLTLQGASSFRAVVSLRHRGRRSLTDAATRALSAMIAASSIELPRDASDPTGRFSRVLYPTHLTKEQTAALVADPPGDGQPLPVGPRATGA